MGGRSPIIRGMLREDRKKKRNNWKIQRTFILYFTRARPNSPAIFNGLTRRGILLIGTRVYFDFEFRAGTITFICLRGFSTSDVCPFAFPKLTPLVNVDHFHSAFRSKSFFRLSSRRRPTLEFATKRRTNIVFFSISLSLAIPFVFSCIKRVLIIKHELCGPKSNWVLDRPVDPNWWSVNSFQMVHNQNGLLHYLLYVVMKSEVLGVGVKLSNGL